MRLAARTFAAMAAALMAFSLLAAPAVTAAAPTWGHRDVHVCGSAGAGTAACASVAHVLYQNGQPYVAKSPGDLGRIAKPAASVSYTAVGIRTAYGITGPGDPSRVIAIVDAYDNPNAYSHLSTYRATNTTLMPAMQDCSSSLASLSTGSVPCFAKVNQSGGTTPPSANSGWATEIDLDLQAASAICPLCSILLVEANSSSFADLGAAVTFASQVSGVRAISNSYSSNGDVSGLSYSAWDQAAQQGIAVTASTGDGGYGVGFPASASYVLGVGGTTLNVDSSGARSSETAWSGSGSGCSTYNPGTLQFPSGGKYGTNPCGSMKAIADLSADADPNSGLQIYTTYNHRTGWWIFGGTSLSSPLMGALYAMQGHGSTTYAAQYAWESASYYDVTSGSNGTCSPSVLCNAATGPGWDGPTGLGSILEAPVVQTATSIALTPSSATITTGGSVQFQAVELDQNRNAMTTQPPFSWTASGGTISPGTNGTATFTSSTAGTFTVTAAADNLTSNAATVNVNAPVPDFTLGVNPSTATAKRGTTATYTVTITPSGGFSGDVALSLAGAPSGSSVTFSPSSPVSVTSTAAVSVTLSITTANSTRTKSYSMTLTGTSGSLVHTVPLSLKVTK